MTQDNIPTEYASNQVIEVSEYSRNVSITCSAHTGALLRDGMMQTFPSVTIATITLQHNNTVYKCQRIITDTILFEVRLTLFVIPAPTNATTMSTTTTTNSTIQTTNSTTQTTNSTIQTTNSTTQTTNSTIQTTNSTTQTTNSTTQTTNSTTQTTNSTTPTPITTTPTTPITTTPTTPTPTPTTPITTTPTTPITTTPTTPTPTPTTPITTTTTPTATAATTTTTTTTEQSNQVTIVQVNTTEPSTSQPATTTTTTTMLTTEQIVLLSATILITTVCGILTFVCFFVCCCLRSRPNKHIKLQHSTEFYPDNPTNSLGSISKEEPLPSPFKTEVDPFSQSMLPSEYKECLCELWEQEYDQLIQEYNSLGGVEMRYSANTAEMTSQTVKNRYKNILPYDRSRVVLRGDTGIQGYINASHIPGILIPHQFISSQGPKDNTVTDFWVMLWENSVRHLIMLTRLIERGKKKCEQYWPERVGDGEHVGDMFVTLVNLVTEDMWTIREMVVRNGTGEKRVVKQMQFTGWPDFEAPKHPRDLILFLQRVKLEVAEDTSVICVHCSAGVGRSGTFIALYNLMEQVGDGTSSSINIWNVVNEMREHRPQMVQAWTQYRFIYLAVLELIQGDTCVQVNNFPHYFQFRLDTHSPIFTTQFHELDFQSDKTYTRLIERAFDVDAVNPDTMVLPFDDTRVILSDTFWDGTDYINASYVEGYSGARDYIATQLPVSDSVRDMMQLVYQTKSPVVVLLASYLEFDDMSYDEGRIRYWPVPMTQHEFNGYTLMNENTFIDPLFNKLKLVSVEQGEGHEFTLVTLLDWTKAGEFGTTPDCLQRLFQVTQFIKRCQEEHLGRPIIIQCKDGSGATGVLIAALNSIGQIKSGGNVDIFQTAKRLRCCRQLMINSLVSAFLTVR